MDGDEIEEWLLLPSSDISDTEDGNENDEGELEDQIFSKEHERQLVQNHLSLNENMVEEGEEGIIVEEAQIEDDPSQIDTWDESDITAIQDQVGEEDILKEREEVIVEDAQMEDDTPTNDFFNGRDITTLQDRQGEETFSDHEPIVYHTPDWPTHQEEDEENNDDPDYLLPGPSHKKPRGRVRVRGPTTRRGQIANSTIGSSVVRRGNHRGRVRTRGGRGRGDRSRGGRGRGGRARGNRDVSPVAVWSKVPFNPPIQTQSL